MDQLCLCCYYQDTVQYDIVISGHRMVDRFKSVFIAWSAMNHRVWLAIMSQVKAVVTSVC